MSSKKGFKIQQLESAEQLDELMESSDRVIIVDAYKGWCGPTVVMEATFQRIFASTEDALNRLAFVAMDRESIVAHSGFEKLTLNSSDVNSCRPLFVCFKQKRAVGKVSGANAPDLMSLVSNIVAADF